MHACDVYSSCGGMLLERYARWVGADGALLLLCAWGMADVNNLLTSLPLCVYRKFPHPDFTFDVYVATTGEVRVRGASLGPGRMGKEEGPVAANRPQRARGLRRRLHGCRPSVGLSHGHMPVGLSHGHMRQPTCREPVTWCA